MSCARASLLTNSTRVPGATVTSFGLTPDAVMVIVLGFGGRGSGVDGDAPPHESIRTLAVRAAARIRMRDYAIGRVRQRSDGLEGAITGW